MAIKNLADLTAHLESIIGKQQKTKRSEELYGILVKYDKSPAKANHILSNQLQQASTACIQRQRQQITPIPASPKTQLKHTKQAAITQGAAATANNKGRKYLLTFVDPQEYQDLDTTQIQLLDNETPTRDVGQNALIQAYPINPQRVPTSILAFLNQNYEPDPAKRIVITKGRGKAQNIRAALLARFCTDNNYQYLQQMFSQSIPLAYDTYYNESNMEDLPITTDRILDITPNNKKEKIYLLSKQLPKDIYIDIHGKTKEEYNSINPSFALLTSSELAKRLDEEIDGILTIAHRFATMLYGLGDNQSPRTADFFQNHMVPILQGPPHYLGESKDMAYFEDKIKNKQQKSQSQESEHQTHGFLQLLYPQNSNIGLQTIQHLSQEDREKEDGKQRITEIKDTINQWKQRLIKENGESIYQTHENQHIAEHLQKRGKKKGQEFFQIKAITIFALQGLIARVNQLGYIYRQKKALQTSQ